MNFLNVGPWELAVILIIAILLVGPRRAAEIARTIGRATSQMRRLSEEFLSTIQVELQATGQEARQALESVAESDQEPIASIPDEIQATERETRQVMQEIIEDVETVVKGGREIEEAQDEEACRE